MANEFNWNYEKTTGFEIPTGCHRLRIKDAEKAVSKTGNDMLVLTLEVSGMRSTIRHYITFLRDKPEITNRNLTNVFQSFGITDFNLAGYRGKAGAGYIEKDGEYDRIKYFISGSKKDELPQWKDPQGGFDSSNREQTQAKSDNSFDSDVPF